MVPRRTPPIHLLSINSSAMSNEAATNETTSLDLCRRSFEAAMVDILQNRLCNDKRKANAVRRAMLKCTPLRVLHARFDDPSEALNYSLQQLAAAIRARMVRKREKSAAPPRELQLMLALGSSRYGEVMALVRTIRMLRLSRAASGCPGWGACSKQRSLPTVIPSPASQVFFNNQLSKVVDNAPTNAFADQDWDSLMKQANEDIGEYMEWSDKFEIQHVPSRRDQEFKPRTSMPVFELVERAPILIEDIDDVES